MPDSYVVVDKKTGKGVFEFFEKKNRKHINLEKYDVLTATEYLTQLNKRIKQEELDRQLKEASKNAKTSTSCR